MKTIISIHSLRVEGDPAATSEEGVDKIFQSTPSVWRETVTEGAENHENYYFNPLPPCGGRPCCDI